MSLSLQAFAPAALLLLGAIALLWRPSATLFVLVQVATLGALLRLSQLSAATLSVPVYDPLQDVPLVLRLDRLSLFFATAAVAAALLVALPWVGDRNRRLPLGWLVLAEFGAVGGMLAGNLQGLAAGWGVYVTALLLLVLVPEPAGRGVGRLPTAVTRTLVVQMAGAALVLLAAVTIEALTGTANYDAVPVAGIDGPTQVLLVAAPVLALATLAGLQRACRQPAVSAVMVTAVVLPLAGYTLARTVDLAEGRALRSPAGAGLVAAAAVGATLFGLYAVWAPDLGSAIARLLNALGLLLVATYAVGGSGALVALLVGFMSLEVVAGAALVLVDAAGGRLPGAAAVPRWLLAILALSPLAGLGGLVLAMGLDTRLLFVRAILDHGGAWIVLAVPLVAAWMAILAGAVAAGRFGGGRASGRRGVIQLGLAAAALAGLEAGAPALRDIAVVLSASATRAPAADVRSSAAAAVPGSLLGLGLLALVMTVLVVAASRRDFYDGADGLRLAPDVLPPAMAVTPEIAARTIFARGEARGRAALAIAAVHPRWSTTLAWLAAIVVVVFAAR